MAMLRFVVVVFAVNVRIATNASGDTFTVRNSLLAGSTYRTLTGESWLECFRKCLSDATCLSYNFFKAPDERSNICELNEATSSNACDSARHLISSQGWIYNQIKTVKEDCGGACSEITANITCDNRCTAYADGISLGEDNANWVIETKFTFPRGTKTIGIHGKDSGGIAALIGSFSNGIVTDRSWKCSNTHYPGWSTKGFDDSAWPAAVEHGVNGVKPWGRRKVIASTAKWIWTQDANNDNDVYCRIEV